MTVTHPRQLSDGYGTTAVEPVCRLRFTLAGAEPVVVTPTDGALTRDASAWPRTTCRATLPTTITPSLLPAAVSAYGGRVVVTMGANVSGREYVFTAATLAVSRVVIDRPDAAVRLEACSFESVVNEDRYDTRTLTPPGTVSAVVAGIVRRTLPGVVVRNLLGGLDVALAAGAFELDGDVWPTVEAIMDRAGGEAWFDADGALVLRPVPVVGASSLTIGAGAGGALTGYSSTRQWGANRVALVWEDDAEPPNRRVGVWADTRGGATDVTGPYGRHTYREEYAVPQGQLPTQPAADAAAAAMARRVAGLFRQVAVRGIPAPWLEPGDTVRLGMLGGLTEDHLVQAVDLPLPGLDVMTLTTRDATYTGGPF